VAEETGVHASVGRRLEIGHYGTAAGPQAVEYWAMQGPDTLFTPTAEVDGLAWMPLADARRRLDYHSDGYAINALKPLPAAALIAAVLLVRNGQAVPRWQWAGSDVDRPLDATGQGQARDLSRTLPPFGPSELLSACGARFAETLRPLGAELGLTVTDEPALDDDKYARYPGRAQSRIMELASVEGGPAVVCASGEVIRRLLATLGEDTWLARGGFPASHGSVYALFFVGGQLAAADYYPACGYDAGTHDPTGRG
jgi:8-oxo-dGTP diphosphatase